jgi:predicted nucleic acid-binding protein
MIAALAIEHGISLLHNDRGFDLIAKYGALKVEKK